MNGREFLVLTIEPGPLLADPALLLSLLPRGLTVYTDGLENVVVRQSETGPAYIVSLLGQDLLTVPDVADVRDLIGAWWRKHQALGRTMVLSCGDARRPATGGGVRVLL